MTIHAKHKELAGAMLFVAILACCDVVGEEPAADQPSESIEFAIAGIIDLDDDGMSDVGELRSVIANHNGKVSAICASDGTVVGKITKSTSYLIVGTPPELQSEARTAFVEFVCLAKKAGVEIVAFSQIEFGSDSSTSLGLFKSTPAPWVFDFGPGPGPPGHPQTVRPLRAVKPTYTLPIPNPFIRQYPHSRWNGW